MVIKACCAGTVYDPWFESPYLVRQSVVSPGYAVSLMGGRLAASPADKLGGARKHKGGDGMYGEETA